MLKNYRSFYVAEKRIASKLSKPLVAQIEDFNEDFLKISILYLLYSPRNNPSKSVTVGSGQAEPYWIGSGQVGPVHRFKRFS